MKTIKNLCGAMLAVLAFTACESNNDDAVADGGSYLQHVTLQASMGGADTRALSEGAGNAIIAEFEEGDQVVVIDADRSTIVGTLTATTAGPKTTLTGDLNTSTLAPGEEVTLRYRSATANYDGQKGTLSDIATSQDFAEGWLTVMTVTPSLTFESDDVTLAARQSITKFSFTSGGSPVNVKTFGIAAEGLVQRVSTNATKTYGTVTGTLETPSSAVYVALRNGSNMRPAYSFYIKDSGDNWYTASLRANLVVGKNYAASVALTRLPALDGSSAAGAIGVVSGLPAIVVELGGVKKAISLMNAGALCPEDLGGRYTFGALPTISLPAGWMIPSETDLEALRDVSTKKWATQYGVDGYLFTIADGKTLFLPAAGYYDNQSTPGLWDVSTAGNYWSTTAYSDYPDLAVRLNFSSTGYMDVLSDYKVNQLSVRPIYTFQ